MGNTVVFAYCGEAKEVLWFYEEDDPEGGPKHNLCGRQADWLVKGEVFTILEYHPNGVDGELDMSARAIWWDERLRGLGYDINTD